ncbi:MAG: alpha-1,4-glucan--maltose-1-phosphate maltosyltransferase [Deltaproteobacteria bacterium]|nr:alpha-1,4-glucan--maltose-1-phosphate maltosyltransferase [Deltaproteobacteria bacterium]
MLVEKRNRVVIEDVKPEIDGGLFAIKRVAREKVIVEADIFAEGHDVIACCILYRFSRDKDWREEPMKPLVNDRWQGEFKVTQLGEYVYTVMGWIDRFSTWQRDFAKRVAAAQDVTMELIIGAELVEQAAARSPAGESRFLMEKAKILRSGSTMEERLAAALDETLKEGMLLCQEKPFPTRYHRELTVCVERERARFSTWYELFPRSCVASEEEHGTLADCRKCLPEIAKMGFDVLYLPPVHPIGTTHRKGKNNTTTAMPDDVGSPWAIGAGEGGHKAIHPALGTLEDLKVLIAEAQNHGMEIAMDLAYQCSPDHPYVREHAEWFRKRPDGTIQYAENPPKKYQDIFPINFETDAWQELWDELKSVVLFWIDQGIRIFRVDNPHTKPFRFWEWLFGEIRKEYPETIFLAEAFTRPKVMHHLAKLGFSQSYTYFTWRNTKAELMEYCHELTQSAGREYLRPNLWPNTPDILNEYLQFGGRSGFMVRLVLAATLGANYGIYGPAFELCENRPLKPGSEEYLDSEKYQIRQWDLEAPHSLRSFIGRINRVRRENMALQTDWNLKFHAIDNEEMLCFTKHTEDLEDILLVVVNLDPHHMHSGWLEIPLQELGLPPQQPYQVHDLLSEARFLWNGPRNYVELDPRMMPAHIFRIRRKVRSERDFDYYL